ncbi:MAG: hypothetical protein SFV54_12815 [Bryobacteraceae bacterium]|nr:hypothetical protein [Bryobacteraceae bacterium]
MRKTLVLFASVMVLQAEELPAGAEKPISSTTTRNAVRFDAQYRWRNYAQESFLSPGAFFASVMPAVGDHAGDRPAEFGQGWDAFGERLWRRAATYQLQTALYHSSAAVLGSETGYRRCECEGGWRRLGYAVSRTFVTRTQGGTTIPNVALWGGSFGGGMIATAWYPDRYRATSEGVRFGGYQLGARTVVNVFREFGPELKRLFGRR